MHTIATSLFLTSYSLSAMFYPLDIVSFFLTDLPNDGGNRSRVQCSEVQDGYDHAGATRAATGGFITYLIAYEQGQQQKGNPER